MRAKSVIYGEIKREIKHTNRFFSTFPQIPQKLWKKYQKLFGRVSNNFMPEFWEDKNTDGARVLERIGVNIVGFVNNADAHGYVLWRDKINSS
jgi:hypothetical protein